MRTKNLLIVLSLGLLMAAAGLVSGMNTSSRNAEAAEARGAGAGSAIQRFDGAFREDKDGWVFVHIHGEPEQRGRQYGYLLAPEIDGFISFLGVYLQHNTGKDWAYFRNLAATLFLPKLETEYRRELAGIAKGLVRRGYAYDTVDVVALNGFFELFEAVGVIEGVPAGTRGAIPRRPFLRCSAFVATGDWTADGNIVMAHNSWDDYVLGERWNVVLDIKPARGERVLMQTAPGLIHSGTDFAINSAGICITETTIGNFVGFDPKGVPEFMRMRKAVQYSKNLDDVVSIMRDGNNGGYANTWLMGDIKNREIGKLELGLLNVTFSRSKTGYYDGENYVDDSKMIREECGPTLWGTLTNWPGDLDGANCVTARRLRWHALLAEHRGKIDAELAKEFLGDQYEQMLGRINPGGMVLMARMELTNVPEIPGASAPRPFGANDGKVVTAGLARNMSFWVRIGHPDGSPFAFGPFLQQHPEFAWQAPYLKDLVTEPWSFFKSKNVP
jgi:hypothetical protein